MASSLSHYRRSRSLASSEAQLFRAAARALADIVAPHLNACYLRVFEPSAVKPLDLAPAMALLEDALAE